MRLLLRLINTKSFWFIVLILSIFGPRFFREDVITHVVLNDGKTKIRIPWEIVVNRDCDKYREWLHSNSTPLAVWSDRCPWSKPPKGPIGEFTIGGVNFWVPREYLWPDTQIPDGEEGVLNLLMIYPDMKPATGKEEERNYEVMVTICISNSCKPGFDEYISELKKIKAKPCDAQQNTYMHMMGIKEEEKGLYPKKLKYMPHIDLTLYDANTVELFYIRGNKYKPTYWLACNRGERVRNWNPGCESVFNINGGKLHIRYLFRKTDLLPFHDDVRRKVVKKIEEFSNKQGDK